MILIHVSQQKAARYLLNMSNVSSLQKLSRADIGQLCKVAEAESASVLHKHVSLDSRQLIFASEAILSQPCVRLRTL